MYLSRFSLDSGTWVQAVIRLVPVTGGGPLDYGTLLDVPGLAFTLRFAVGPEGAEILLAASAPEKHEALLQESFTAWRSKISGNDATLEISESASMRDAWMNSVPLLRVQPSSTFSAHGVPLLCTYLIFPKLEELIASAVAAKSRLVFQVSCLKSALNLKQLGQLRKEMVRLSFVEHVPPLLVRHQERTTLRLPDDPWLIEEFLAVESAHDLEWLESMIQEDFNLTYARLGFPDMVLSSGDDGSCDDSFFTGFPKALLCPEEGDPLNGARLRQDELGSLCQIALPRKAEPQLQPGQASQPASAGGFDVFISHSSRDRQTANALCHLLEQDGFRCWIAPRDIRPGEIWAESIPRGIKTSRIMVVVFSESSNLSRQVLREVERAVHFGVTIIPFRIEKVPMTDAMAYLLAVPHWFDALTPPLEKQLIRLVAEIRGQLRGSPSEMSPAPPSKV